MAGITGRSSVKLFSYSHNTELTTQKGTASRQELMDLVTFVTPNSGKLSPHKQMTKTPIC